MIRKKALPQKADIFKNHHLHKGLRFSSPHVYLPHMSTPVALKSTGVLTLVLFLLFGVKVVFSSAQTTYKEVASAVSGTTPSSDASTANWKWDNGYIPPGSNYNYNYNGNNGYSRSYNNYYVAPIPNYQYINTNPGNNNNYNYNNGNGNTAGISGQIIALQQQIGNAMQGCINGARQGANQILTMKSQARQLQQAIDTINNQAGQIDTSTPGGQQRQQQLQNQAQQLQNQLDNLNNNINNYQDRLGQNNDHCRQNLDNLINAREDAEGKLNDAFNNGMNITTDLPN